MATGDRDDPRVINPEFRAAVAYLGRMIHPRAGEDEVAMFIRAVSPQIIHSVGPGEYFRFQQNPALVFQLLQKDGRYYIRRDGFDSRLQPLYDEEDAPSWFTDRINEAKKRAREFRNMFSPFSQLPADDQ